MHTFFFVSLSLTIDTHFYLIHPPTLLLGILWGKEYALLLTCTRTSRSPLFSWP